MKIHNLGYPRMGANRELKKANENYWSGKINQQQLEVIAKNIRCDNLLTQQEAGIDFIPCNDFSFYDHMLDMSLMVNAIPERYFPVIQNKANTELDLYFAMARGYQKEGLDITAMEMTKWLDTNYHYIVPEFTENQHFSFFSERILINFHEAKATLKKAPKVVLVGPVSFLLLGKEKGEGFHRLDLLDELLKTYEDVLTKLEGRGAKWIQFDEPCLTLDLTKKDQEAFSKTYAYIRKKFPSLKTFIATYFECTGNNIETAVNLPTDVLHIDLVRCPSQLDDILKAGFKDLAKTLSLGIVDGRNIWKNDYKKSLGYIHKAIDELGEERVILAPSCSLLHVPYDLDNEKKLNPEIKNWMAFAKQKLWELNDLRIIVGGVEEGNAIEIYAKNQASTANRKTSTLIHKIELKKRIENIKTSDFHRHNSFEIRQQAQSRLLKLPLLPTTTIGSFPQTEEVRSMRAKFKKGEISNAEYDSFIAQETLESIKFQEETGIDVLVHGEFERNDMVEYFGELLEGFVFTENGWVQSYGSRCVKPPVIFGDIERKAPMTVKWTTYAQSLTKKWMKGMLTGPVTILQWSFVRDDQSRKETCMQIALAIRDEVLDLEKAGINIIQIDEPAIREGLPLRKENREHYLNWAVESFRLAASGVRNETQIHTHMCYSEFNDIIRNIAEMDADVITIETSRSQMELLDAFVDFKYPNEIGPGVYDIHSPRVPSRQEIIDLLEKALQVLPLRNVWVNPDCGLKTRKWPETKAALQNMVSAAKYLRSHMEVLA